MKYKIAISGSYGGMNLGDEAILEGILKGLRSSLDVDIVVFSCNPEDTERRHKVRAIPIREIHKDDLLKEIKKLDLFILGGGGILYDGIAATFLRDVVWAQELDIPVFVYAISAGPLNNPDIKQSVAQVLNKTDVITVRDDESKRILHDLGVNKDIEVTADPAFLIQPQKISQEMLKKEGIISESNYVGFSVREPGPAAPDMNVDHYYSILANAADFMIERYDAQILFIPMEVGANRDPQHSHAVVSKMINAQKASVLKGDYTSDQILDLMGHMDFAVGMRLHFLIFAGMQGIPFISLPYAPKVKGLLTELGIPFTSIEDWNSGKLCAVIDHAWDTRITIQKKLAKTIPLIQKKSRITNKMLCDFLKKIKSKKSETK